MKALIVSLYYSPELGAAPSRITNMAEGLQKEGVEVEVLTALPNYPKGRIYEGYRRKFSMHEKVNDVLVHRYWTFATVTKNPILRLLSMFAFSMMLWCFAFKRNLIKSYDYIIIQTPPIMVAHSAIVLFKKLYGKKIILNVSDLWPASAIELGAVKKGSIYHKVLLHMEKFIYHNAYAFQGQSKVILGHIKEFEPTKKQFLYRNLQHQSNVSLVGKKRHTPFKIVYAGLLGVAQDVLSIVEQVNFKELGAELHLFGGGNQANKVQDYIKNHDTGVFYHGYLAKDKMVAELQEHDASVVPLIVQIKGAVPSKIFDLMPVGVPILLCGGSEAADIVNDNKIGFVSSPKDYRGLAENISRLINMSDGEYLNMVNNCLSASSNEYSFEKQMKRYSQFLVHL